MVKPFELMWRQADVDTSDVRTVVYDSVEVGDQHITIIEADARTKPDGITILELPNLEAWADEYQQKRSEILAANAAQNYPGGARVLFAEMPGVNVDTRYEDTITKEQKRQAIREGRLLAHAAAQLEALQQVADFQPGEAVRLFGYSQGGSLSREMIELIMNGHNGADLVITEVDLLEVPNLSDRSPLSLGIASARELPFLDRYLKDQNAAVGLGDIKPIDRMDPPIIDFNAVRKRQLAARYLPTLALRHGIGADLEELQKESARRRSPSGFHNSRKTLWKADGSHLTRDSDHRAAAEMLGADYRILIPSSFERALGEKVQHHVMLGFGNTAVWSAANLAPAA